jgi:hypothetical protein
MTPLARDDFDPIPSTRHRVPVRVASLRQAEEAADALDFFDHIGQPNLAAVDSSG